ncbi:MAG: leucine-rich repeat domain-containing protein [Clostridia bacterium]|nr:leucine-rich repeat domain-containing protein [Clostridia bacterium]
MKKRITGLFLIIVLVACITMVMFACSGGGGLLGGAPKVIYTLQSDNTYAVTGIERKANPFNDKYDIVIDAEYDGLPVTSIAENAFYGFNDMKSITIPASIVKFGKGAFEYPFLEKVTYLGDLSQWCSIDFASGDANPISNTQFYLNEELVSGEIVIPEGITKIPAYAFYRYQHISKIDTGAEVTEIGDGAFYWCSGRLTSVIIGKKVKTIEGSAFSGCNKLVEIYNLSKIEMEVGSTSNGCIAYNAKVIHNKSSLPSRLSKDDAGVVYYTDGDFKSVIDFGEESTHVELPVGVTDINCYAGLFSTLTSVVIPEGVTTIGAEAFNINSITNVSIPSSIRYVGKNAFSYNSRELINTKEDGVYYLGNAQNPYVLAYCIFQREVPGDIKINDGTIVLQDELFSSVSIDINKVTIGNSVWRIADGCFSGRPMIKEVVIGSSVQEIGNKAFIGTNFKSITIPDSVTKLGEEVFAQSQLEEVTIGKGITEIPKSAFSYCKLKQLTLPNQVKAIGDEAFFNNELLESIDLGQVTSIGDKAFYHNVSLKSVELPDSLTHVGKEAFSENDALKSVTIGTGLESIGDSVFSFCNSLTNLTIKEGAEAIGNRMFSSCVTLKEINIPGSVKRIGIGAFGSYYGMGQKACTLTSITLNEGIESIGANAFYGNVDSITIPKSITNIGSAALANINAETVRYAGELKDWMNITFDEASSNPIEYCENFYINDEKLVDLVVPSEVTAIKKYSFRWSKDLKSIETHSGVTRIEEGAFTGCKNLKILTLDSVKTIGDGAFSGTGLMKVVLGNSVRTIGDFAFGRCEDLMQITLGTSFRAIGEDAFYGCIRLVEIFDFSPLKIFIGRDDEYPSIEEEGEYYENDGGLTDVARVVHVNVNAQSRLSLDENGFVHYKKNVDNDNVIDDEDIIINYIGSGTRITLPEGATGMNWYAFYNKDNLKQVVFSEGITEVARSGFQNCDRLQKVVLSSTVTDIDYYAFKNCQNLEYVDVKEGLTTIWGESFHGCPKLRRIYLPTTLVDVADMAFEGCQSLVEVCNNSGRYAGPEDWALGGVGYYAKNIYSNKFGSTKFSEDENGFVYFTNGGQRHLISYLGDDTELVLPSDIDTVYSRAFYINNEITKVTISDGVTEIGINAFSSCRNLEELVIPESVTTIKGGAIGLCKIYYRGTEEQWNAIEKAGNWNFTYESEIIFNYQG